MDRKYKKQYIKDNFNKLSKKEIADHLGITIKNVDTLIRESGLASLTKRLELLAPEVVKSYYENKKTVAETSKLHGITEGSVRVILKKFGQGSRQSSEFSVLYACDINFFDEIDTPEKAYWFGFIAADGGLSDGRLTIKLQERDRPHLEKFKSRIQYEGPILYEINQEFQKLQYRVSISREKLYQSIKNLGMEENKTAKIDENIFNHVPSNLLVAAFHGYFDGDGCFSQRKNTSGIVMSLIGNKRFLVFLKEWLISQGFDWRNAGIYRAKRTKHSFCFNKFLGKKTKKFIFDLFYNNEFSSKDFLDRKKELLQASLQFKYRVNKSEKILNK